MHCPPLFKLPPPPLDKFGWLWTEESPQLPNTMSCGSSWPLISIVTPSFNQGQFLEETIRSVLLQGYPNIEYIIIDGGSSDNSTEIIKKYEPWLTYWISEPDKGQAHAINKGLSHATGKIFGWLNSDDYFHRSALRSLIELRQNNPGSIAWVGACQDIDIYGRPLRWRSPRVGNKKQFANWSRDAWIAQPSCLFDAKAFFDVGKLDEQLDFVLDVDLWMRLAEYGNFASKNKIISYERMYSKTKTRKNIPMQQAEHILINFKLGQPEIAQKRMAECMTFALDAWPFRKLLRYFIKRSISWIWQCFRRLCRL